MKKSLNKKLVLRKRSVATLNGSQMGDVVGGRTNRSCDDMCISSPYLCPSDPGYPSCNQTCDATCNNTCQQTCHLSQCIGSCYWKCPTWDVDCL